MISNMLLRCRSNWHLAARIASCWFLLFLILPHAMGLPRRCRIHLLPLVGLTAGVEAWPKHDFVC